MVIRGTIFHHYKLVFHNGKTFFEKPTWVQLYQIYQFVPDLIIKDPDIKKVGILKPKIIDEIVNCLFLSREKDILPDHKKLLRPPMKKSIQQLAEKWKKH